MAVTIPASANDCATGCPSSSGGNIAPSCNSGFKLTVTAIATAISHNTITVPTSHRGTSLNSCQNRSPRSFFRRNRMSRFRSLQELFTPCGYSAIFFPRSHSAARSASLNLLPHLLDDHAVPPTLLLALRSPPSINKIVAATIAGSAHQTPNPIFHTRSGNTARCPIHSSPRHTYGAVAAPATHDAPHMAHISRQRGSRACNSCARNRTRNCVRAASSRGIEMPSALNERNACCVAFATSAHRAHSRRCWPSHSCSAAEIPSTRSFAINPSARACSSLVTPRLPPAIPSTHPARDTAATSPSKSAWLESSQSRPIASLLETAAAALRDKPPAIAPTKRARAPAIPPARINAAATPLSHPRFRSPYPLRDRSSRPASPLSSAAATQSPAFP